MIVIDKQNENKGNNMIIGFLMIFVTLLISIGAIGELIEKLYCNIKLFFQKFTNKEKSTQLNHILPTTY